MEYINNIPKYDELIDKYGMIDLNVTSNILKEIVSELMNKNEYLEAMNHFDIMIEYMKKFSINNKKVIRTIPNEYFNEFLEQFSFYLLNASITLGKLGNIEKSKNYVETAAFINVKSSDIFLNSCDTLWFSLFFYEGKIAEETLSSKCKKMELEYIDYINNLYEKIESEII